MPNRRQHRVECINIFREIVMMLVPRIFSERSGEPKRRRSGKKHPGKFVDHDIPEKI